MLIWAELRRYDSAVVCQDFLANQKDSKANNRDVHSLHTPRPSQERFLWISDFLYTSDSKSCLSAKSWFIGDYAKFQQWSAKTFSNVWTNFELVIEMYDGYIPLDRRKGGFYPTLDFGCSLLAKVVSDRIIVLWPTLSLLLNFSSGLPRLSRKSERILDW